MKYCCVLVYNSKVKLIGFIWHAFCLISGEDGLITTCFSDFNKGQYNPSNFLTFSYKITKINILIYILLITLVLQNK